MCDLKPSLRTLARHLSVMGAAMSLLTGACATAPAQKKDHPIVGMAVFDLNCPKEQLSYQKLDDGTWGVIGCGQRTKYVQLCSQGSHNVLVGEECRWVRN